MPFQAVPDTAAVHFRATLFGQLIENILYFTKAGGFDSAALADLGDLADVWWNTSVMALLSNQYTYRETFVQDISAEAGDVYTTLANSGEVGADSSAECAPGNVAIAVSLRTGLAGRSFRGRNYVSGLSMNKLTGNQFETAFITDIQAAYAELLDQLVESDFVWVVVSRVAEGVVRAAGITTPVLVPVITDIFVDSMRRRLTGRGQ